MNWAQLVVDLGADEDSWGIAAGLEAEGAMGISLLPLEDTEALLEPEPGSLPRVGAMRLKALFDSRAAADRAALAAGLDERCTHSLLADKNWVEQGRQGFVPQRFGQRLWIVPEWCTPPDPGAINVMLAPGLAFGTGMHPSTALCLEWLAQADLGGQTLIDYGCGSGVLAVAAAKLGASRVVAVDNDPQALEATRGNAARNAVAVEVGTPESLDALVADVVVANILARPLIALAAELCSRVRADGYIILAGINPSQADGVAAAYAASTRLIGRRTRAEWVCLELRRKLSIC